MGRLPSQKSLQPAAPLLPPRGASVTDSPLCFSRVSLNFGTMCRATVSLLALATVLASTAGAQDDPYERYVKTSEDFRRVKQDKAWCLAAFPAWTYMPWTYQWPIGYNEQSGRWSLAHGYNGAFVNGGDIAAEGSPTGRLDWINRFKLRFYTDHTAGKGDLHLWDGDQLSRHLDALHGTGLRPTPLNQAAFEKLRRVIRDHIAVVKTSPCRAAYALDDEISWGHFVHPTMWQVTDESGAFQAWLNQVYGPAAPIRTNWISYEDLRVRLKSWNVAEFDASPLMDQWTFNDSCWNNFIGRLVECANELDPATPCGFVGGQSPNAFGGYDYAKIMRKVQFIEAYNLGSSQAIIRSFNPGNALPTVTTHFHKSVEDDIWQTWYYLAHGNRGFIGWVEDWFNGQVPASWHAIVAPAYREAAEKIGPLISGSEWVHDGVALYYSHSSLQLGWILDAEAHGKTWVNRNGDDRLGSAHHVRRAWENMLRDSGIQFNHLSYVDVIQSGIPPEYRVLVLPACLCLSDAEARRIMEFCRNGGTVIADYLPGIWDQHGRGRPAGGALDALFGVHHDPAMRRQDVFGGNLWCEVDQDANFSWKTCREFLTNQNTCIHDSSGFNKAVRGMGVEGLATHGNGRAVLLNLSPQWYNAHREAGVEAASKRQAFMRHIFAAGVRPWIRLEPEGETTFGREITYWTPPAGSGASPRTFVFVCQNPRIEGSHLGGGNATGLLTNTVQVTLRFEQPVKNARNERTGASLGDGSAFDFDWKQNEAIVLSFSGSPPVRDR